MSFDWKSLKHSREDIKENGGKEPRGPAGVILPPEDARVRQGEERMLEDRSAAN